MIPNSAQLFNRGSIQLYENSSSKEGCTLLVIGQARAGTSMVGSILNQMGIPIGRKIGAVHEDNELGPYLDPLKKGKVTEGFLKVINSRNNEHIKWGWKRPDLYTILSTIIPYLRNPRFVCIFRDPTAIVSRNLISLDGEKDETKVVELYSNTLAEQKLILDSVVSEKQPTLLLSYEKALTRPINFIKSLSNFAGNDLSEKELQKLAKLISPNNLGYSLRAREVEYDGNESFRGILVGVVQGCVRGLIHEDVAKTEMISIWIDGVFIKKCAFESQNNPGWKSFSYDLADKMSKRSHSIQLTFSSSGTNFANSPYLWWDV
jgi:hypothetical protein